MAVGRDDPRGEDAAEHAYNVAGPRVDFPVSDGMTRSAIGAFGRNTTSHIDTKQWPFLAFGRPPTPKRFPSYRNVAIAQESGNLAAFDYVLRIQADKDTKSGCWAG